MIGDGPQLAIKLPGNIGQYTALSLRARLLRGDALLERPDLFSVLALVAEDARPSASSAASASTSAAAARTRLAFSPVADRRTCRCRSASDALREGVAVEHLPPVDGDHHRLLIEDRRNVSGVAVPGETAGLVPPSGGMNGRERLITGLPARSMFSQERLSQTRSRGSFPDVPHRDQSAARRPSPAARRTSRAGPPE